MIIGTAGHIDHGKTALVKALTGVDTDRLKEEKARGITVDLGFAYLRLPDGTVAGFVDVPGHEKLVRNMLAGATGIDHVLLVVAADDGPMPQTREHLAILDLLGLRRGVVVLSKCDRVDGVRLAGVRAELHTLLAGTALADAPLLSVSAVTGEGMDALHRHLAEAAQALPPAEPRGGFRLAVDRAFTLGGVGTVLTGTALSGRVAVGDRLRLSPAGHTLRVRGIHAHNQPADEGRAGQRLALAVAGVDKPQVRRGDMLLAEPLHAPTRRLDVRLQLLASEPRPLAHWTPLHLHLGAEDVGARVVLLEGQALAPGHSACVQLELERPISALHADRFIVRDQSALRTVGGGAVIDPFAPDNRRRRSQRLAVLAAMELPTPAAALAALLALDLPQGVAFEPLAVAWNLTPDERSALREAVPHELLDDGGPPKLFAPGRLARWGEQVSAHLAQAHRASPDSPGLTTAQLTLALRDKPAGALWPALLQRLLKAGTLQRRGPHWALAGHSVMLQGVEKQLWERIKPWLDEGGIHPPKLSDLLARDRSLRRDAVMRLFERLQRMGQVHAVGAEYMIQTPHLLALALHAHRLAEADPQRRLNVKALREATGMSRHLSVPLVEYFDAIGLTRRDAVGRHFRRDPRTVFEG